MWGPVEVEKRRQVSREEDAPSRGVLTVAKSSQVTAERSCSRLTELPSANNFQAVSRVLI